MGHKAPGKNQSAKHTEVQVDTLPKCDFCAKPATFDGKTHMGPWAYLCDSDFRVYGIGLGLGRGQKLIARELSQTQNGGA